MKKIVKQNLTTAAESTSIAVASAATVYTKAVRIDYADSFSLTYQAATTGTPALQIEIEQGDALPATEGAADSSWSVPSGVATVESALAVKTIQSKDIYPATKPFMRLKITGGATNPADTVLTATLNRQEDF